MKVLKIDTFIFLSIEMGLIKIIQWMHKTLDVYFKGGIKCLISTTPTEQHY